MQKTEVGTEAEAMEHTAHWLTLPGLLSLSNSTQDLLLRVGICPYELGPPPTIINQDNTLQTNLQST